MRPWRIAVFGLLLAGVAEVSPAPAAPASHPATSHHDRSVLALAPVEPPLPPLLKGPPPPLPPPDTSGFVPIRGGAHIHYEIFGHGQPVVLLHGGLGDSSAWGYQVPLLAERYEVIAIDTRGHGASSRPAHSRLSYDDFADDVVAVLDALAVPRAAVVGWSDGAIVGLDLAIHDPGRVVGLFAFAANFNPSGLINHIDPETLGDDDDDEDLEAAVNRLWATEPQFTPDQLGGIYVPTEIVAGEHDQQIYRTHTEALAKRIPGAELVILPRVGHRGLWRDPDRFNAVLLAFLNALYPV